MDNYKKSVCKIEDDKQYKLSDLSKIIGKTERQIYDMIRMLNIPYSLVKHNKTRLLIVSGYDYKNYIINKKDKKENIVRNAILNNISKIDVNKDYSLKELACILNVSIATLRKYISKNIDISERKINYA